MVLAQPSRSREKGAALSFLHSRLLYLNPFFEVEFEPDWIFLKLRVIRLLSVPVPCGGVLSVQSALRTVLALRVHTSSSQSG